MINAVRTWLLNVPGNADYGPEQGDEYVPLYRPVAPPPALAAVRAALFGDSPDRLYLNYMVRQYLTILHAGDYADHVLSYDPRITYDVRPCRGLFTFAVAEDPPSSSHPLTISGTPRADDVRGRASFAWGVTLSEGGDVATIVPADPTIPWADAPVEFVDGLSAAIPLPGSPLSVAIPGGTPGGMRWRVTATVRPGAGPLDAAARVAELGREAASALFGEAPGEPYRTYANLWADHPEPLGRLTGVLLALARRTAELSGGSGN